VFDSEIAAAARAEFVLGRLMEQQPLPQRGEFEEMIRTLQRLRTALAQADIDLAAFDTLAGFIARRVQATTVVPPLPVAPRFPGAFMYAPGAAFLPPLPPAPLEVDPLPSELRRLVQGWKDTGAVGSPLASCVRAAFKLDAENDDGGAGTREAIEEHLIRLIPEFGLNRIDLDAIIEAVRAPMTFGGWRGEPAVPFTSSPFASSDKCDGTAP
jgi:hypothetical protein